METEKHRLIFQLDETNGDITLVSNSVDFESGITVFQFTLVITDAAGTLAKAENAALANTQSARPEAQYAIHVININEPPTLLDSVRLIREDTPIGSTPIIIDISDPDGKSADWGRGSCHG